MRADKTNIKYLLIGALIPLIASDASAQDGRLGGNDTILVNSIVYLGDTIPAKTLEWVWIDGYFSPHQRKKKAEWTRLRNAVYVTYPYARRAGAIINDINSKLEAIPSKNKRKDYLKTREKELKKEFADPLSDLSVYQGKVLMKLINRQTGNNCYELISEYKGSFTARFWQTVAFVFGSNLKLAYDASGEDRQIESIVEEVERMYY
jgi:Domain of unknown function (DUF4294)